MMFKTIGNRAMELPEHGGSEYMQIKEISEKLGYLTRATEDNTKNIAKFYELLEKHMNEEDRKQKQIDRKMLFIGAALLIILADDLPWSSLLSIVRVAL